MRPALLLCLLALTRAALWPVPAGLDDTLGRLLRRAAVSAAARKSDAQSNLAIEGEAEGEIRASAGGSTITANGQGTITAGSTFTEDARASARSESGGPRSQAMQQALNGAMKDMLTLDAENEASSTGTGNGQTSSQSDAQGSVARGRGSEGFAGAARHRENRSQVTARGPRRL